MRDSRQDSPSPSQTPPTPLPPHTLSPQPPHSPHLPEHQQTKPYKRPHQCIPRSWWTHGGERTCTSTGAPACACIRTHAIPRHLKNTYAHIHIHIHIHRHIHMHMHIHKPSAESPHRSTSVAMKPSGRLARNCWHTARASSKSPWEAAQSTWSKRPRGWATTMSFGDNTNLCKVCRVCRVCASVCVESGWRGGVQGVCVCVCGITVERGCAGCVRVCVESGWRGGVQGVCVCVWNYGGEGGGGHRRRMCTCVAEQSVTVCAW